MRYRFEHLKINSTSLRTYVSTLYFFAERVDCRKYKIYSHIKISYCNLSNFFVHLGKWLVSGQLKCWEAEQVLTLEGPKKAMEVLEEASSLLNRAKSLETQDSYDAELKSVFVCER